MACNISLPDLTRATPFLDGSKLMLDCRHILAFSARHFLLDYKRWGRALGLDNCSSSRRKKRPLINAKQNLLYQKGLLGVMRRPVINYGHQWL